MDTYSSSAHECLVYPGAYTPQPEFAELQQQPGTTGNAPLAVTIKELERCFMLEVVVPGVRRDDLFIYTDENVLSIVVLHKDHQRLKKEWRVSDLDARCFIRQIVLPVHADIEFVSAEYRRGVLYLHILKDERVSANTHHQIVVY